MFNLYPPECTREKESSDSLSDPRRLGDLRGDFGDLGGAVRLFPTAACSAF